MPRSWGVLLSLLAWGELPPATRADSPAHLSHTVCLQAVEQKRKADDIAAVLYPNDATE